MEKELLESYRSKKAEIRELTNKILRMEDEDSMVGNDTILDYRSGYPVPQAVVGVDHGKIKRMENRYRNRIQKLKDECASVEDFIESIPDSLTRRIFRLRFLEGYTQNQISRKVHLDQSRVSRKIDYFLKNA